VANTARSITGETCRQHAGPIGYRASPRLYPCTVATHVSRVQAAIDVGALARRVTVGGRQVQPAAVGDLWNDQIALGVASQTLHHALRFGIAVSQKSGTKPKWAAKATYSG
jgi:hypothetical protein